MNKILKRFLPVLLVVTLVTGLSGCSVIDSVLGGKSKTYGEYVQSLLDSSYKEEFTKYMDLTESTKSEAQASYDEYMEYEAELFLSYMGASVTDEAIEAILPAVKTFYKKASYQVSEAEKVDGDYVATVTVNPSNLMTLMDEYAYAWLDEWETRNDAGDFDDITDEAEYYALIDADLQTVIVNALNDAVITEEAEEFKITIIETTDLYSVSDAALDDVYYSIVGYME